MRNVQPVCVVAGARRGIIAWRFLVCWLMHLLFCYGNEPMAGDTFKGHAGTDEHLGAIPATGVGLYRHEACSGKFFNMVGGGRA